MRLIGRIDVAPLRALAECADWSLQPGTTGHPLRRVALCDWPILDALTQLISGDVRRARWSKLLPGGWVPWHSDAIGVRVHVPIETNDHTSLFVGKKAWHLEVGDVWRFEPQQLHSAVNGGTTDRTHLVLDIVPVLR